MKVSTRRGLFEFGSIVIAVVLAMGLTEWRQSYLNRNMAEATFEKVVQEVSVNLEELKNDSARVAKDLVVMQDWVQKSVNDEKPDPWRVGFTYSFLSNSALEVAKINQSLSFLSSEKVLDISEVYSTQDFYAEKATKVFDIMAELQALVHRPDSQEFFSVVQRFRFHMNLILNTMKAYIRESQEFLEKYDLDKF